MPAEAPEQPDICQLGASLYDAKWNRVSRFSCLIKPTGWSIEPEALSKHGITEARCHKYGIDIRAALAMFQGFVAASMQIVAFNHEFDRKVIKTALHRAGSRNDWWLKRAPSMVCAMQTATPVIGLPSPYGGHKFPTLEEAYGFMFPGVLFVQKHDADDDIEATAKIVQKLQQQGHWPEIKFGA